MNEIEKLFRKISKKDRVALQNVIENLLNKKQNTNIKKLQGSDFYRIRKGNFRIIFHYDLKKEIIIDSIRVRNENTYKNF
ncbi:MAG: type II toxin-antitoxin system RelE/ParE family toxin [bacterium]